MCRVMEDYQRAAVEEATRRGRREGEASGKKAMAAHLYQMGMDIDTIARISEYPKETVAEWLKN